MSHTLQIDPIAHAWRHCNPHAPLPSALAQHVAPSGLAVSLYWSKSRLVAEWSGTQDTQHGLLTVATLPLISLPMGEMSAADTDGRDSPSGLEQARLLTVP
jgi:hypothetical protein